VREIAYTTEPEVAKAEPARTAVKMRRSFENIAAQKKKNFIESSGTQLSTLRT
jgi:hypothetical protein